MTLTRLERTWVSATWDAIFPHGASSRLRLGIRDLDIDGFLTDLERSMTARWMLGFRLAVLVIALAPLVVLGKLRTVAGLTAPERVRLLESLGRSNIYLVRQFAALMKVSGSLLYCGTREVREALAGHGHAPFHPSPQGPRVAPQRALVPVRRLARHAAPAAPLSLGEVSLRASRPA